MDEKQKTPDEWAYEIALCCSTPMIAKVVKEAIAQGADVERKAVLERLVEAGIIDDSEFHETHDGGCPDCGSDRHERCCCTHNAIIKAVTNA